MQKANANWARTREDFQKIFSCFFEIRNLLFFIYLLVIYQRQAKINDAPNRRKYVRKILVVNKRYHQSLQCSTLSPPTPPLPLQFSKA